MELNKKIQPETENVSVHLSSYTDNQ